MSCSIIKVTTDTKAVHGHQDSSLICQTLSDPPYITHLDEASLTNIVDMISEREISINADTKTAGCMKLPNILTGGGGNLPLEHLILVCLFK